MKKIYRMITIVILCIISISTCLLTNAANPIIPHISTNPEVYDCSRCYGTGWEPTMTRNCTKCNGSGVYRSQPRACPVCNAQGTVKDRFGNDVKCHHCDGARYLIDEGTCPKCGGSGSERMKCMSCKGSGKVYK